MISTLKPLLQKLTSYAQGKMGFERPPELFLKNDKKNSSNVFGKTAHYDPSNMSITIYTHGRHPKDILRSYAHELVHHTQNLRGDLSPEKCGRMTKTYAQDNKHMRNMEKEAYLVGNMCFRDWEDSCKMNLRESRLLKENKKMSNTITKKYLEDMIREIIAEQSKTDLPDRVAGRDAGGRRLDEEEEECEKCGHRKSKREDKKVTEGEKKPDADGDGVPDWADKKDGEDDSDSKEEIKEEGKNHEDDEDHEDDDSGARTRGRFVGLEEEASESSKTQTPEDEEKLYESRFGKRNADLFEKLTKLWSK